SKPRRVSSATVRPMSSATKRRTTFRVSGDVEMTRSARALLETARRALRSTAQHYSPSTRPPRLPPGPPNPNPQQTSHPGQLAEPGKRQIRLKGMRTATATLTAGCLAGCLALAAACGTGQPSGQTATQQAASPNPDTAVSTTPVSEEATTTPPLAKPKPVKPT